MLRFEMPGDVSMTIYDEASLFPRFLTSLLLRSRTENQKTYNQITQPEIRQISAAHDVLADESREGDSPPRRGVESQRRVVRFDAS